jgi:hypothetical protein
MRQETKRRLERAIWMERAKYAGMGLAVCLMMAALFTWISADASVVKVRVPATVAIVKPLPSKTQPGLLVDVKLADGRLVEVIANELTDPKVGEQVEITEHRHATGRKNYSWK